MNNHIHILLTGSYENCLAYYDRVIHRIVQMLSSKYGLSGILRQKDLDVVAVMSERQLKREICYIHRNPYKARISSPDAYLWSSADVYFKTVLPLGSSVKILGTERKREIFHLFRLIQTSLIQIHKQCRVFRSLTETLS